MTDPIDIAERLAGLSADHGPDGWPAVQMRDITALCAEVTSLRAALAQAGAPEGWQLVPVEPTPWMLQALFGYWLDCINNPKMRNVATAEYKAMLTAAAALPHPSPAQREPLSDEQIDSAPALTLAEYSVRVGRHELRQFARQIEAACAAAWGVMLTATASGTKGAAS